MLVNGNLHDLASTLGSCPAGLQLRSLVHHHRDAGADSWLRIPAGGGTERFAALNAALCTDALLIDAASTVTTGTVLHLQIDALGDEPTMSHPRVLVRLASGAGLVSVHFVNVTDHRALVAPFRGTDARFSTNPVCIALPGTDREPPLLLDMATSSIAMGKVRVAMNDSSVSGCASSIARSAARSTLPFGVSGRASRSRNDDGTKYSGSRCCRYARSCGTRLRMRVA